MNQVRVTVRDDGRIEFIYTDELSGLLALGESVTRRASDVEPGEGGWHADMRRQGGPVLGPFSLRREALTAEVAWLRQHRGL